MVRVTILQWCNRLELAKGMGEVLVLGWNLGAKGDLSAVGYDTMMLLEEGWFSLTARKLIPPTEFKPIIFAKPHFPSELQDFLKECEEDTKLYEEFKKNGGN